MSNLRHTTYVELYKSTRVLTKVQKKYNFFISFSTVILIIACRRYLRSVKFDTSFVSLS